MKAIICNSYGAPDVLHLADLPDLSAGPSQIRIAVRACGVNFSDTLIIQNKYQEKPELPFSPGGEICGFIDQVGAGVTEFSVGDHVICMAAYGGFSQQVLAGNEAVIKCPETMPSEIAAGFAITYGTSLHAFRQRANLQAGETVLVLGASGGVGLTAIEIAKLMGARVIAGASTDAKLAIAKAAGADELINYSDQNLRARIKEITGGKGVDVVYDPIGGDMLELALRSTAWNGRVLVVGFASGKIPKIPANLALVKGVSIVGVAWGAFRTREPHLNKQNFKQLFDWYNEGKLKPKISKTYPLEHAASALQEILDRTSLGKTVLTID